MHVSRMIRVHQRDERVHAVSRSFPLSSRRACLARPTTALGAPESNRSYFIAERLLNLASQPWRRWNVRCPFPLAAHQLLSCIARTTECVHSYAVVVCGRIYIHTYINYMHTTYIHELVQYLTTSLSVHLRIGSNFILSHACVPSHRARKQDKSQKEAHL